MRRNLAAGASLFLLSLLATAALGLGIACGSQDNEEVPAGERPGPAALLLEPSRAPEELRPLLAADFSFEGCWRRNTEPGYACSFLRIRASGDARFTIDFRHATHSGNSEHSYDAVWSGVSLDSSDASRFPRALYPIRVQGYAGFLAAENAHVIGTSRWYDTTVFWEMDEEDFKKELRVWDLFGGDSDSERIPEER